MRDPETIDRFVRRLQIALQAQHFDRARRIVDEAETAFTSPAEVVTLDTSLAAIDGLPVRVVGILDASGVRTIGDALRLTPDELAAIPSVGAKSVRQIVETLRRLLTTTKGRR